jgi:phytanoyl-CoA hydroxylase
VSRKKILNKNNHIISDLWIDKPYALDELTRRVDEGHIRPELKSSFKDFIQKGYCVLDLNLTDEFSSHTVSEAWKLLENKPKDLLAASVNERNGRLSPSHHFNDLTNKNGIRLIDAHSHSQNLLSLSLHEKLHDFYFSATEKTPVATQSLYFPRGSTQSLHRDPCYVVTSPVPYLMAAWIALEDIHIDSGPLMYVPGSHRLPYNPLNTGDIIFHEPGVTDTSKKNHMEALKSEIEKIKLPTEFFTPKMGQALIWHHSLVHGGAPVNDETLTRNSYVIHFDAKDNHLNHAQSVFLDDDDSSQVFRTQHIDERKGRYSFGNPFEIEKNK